jgi:tetratricopeptide (TPR) repeat protein
MNKKCKIVMITMFKNEARSIERMLNSCLPFVDYYVLQNNGSTDGSDQIVKDFLINNELSGTLYDVEEGWVGFGWNRDHLIQTCQDIDHGCDWILKMDCDEVLEIDSNFNWELLSDKSTQAFHIPAVSGTCVYYRAWMWNANLPWRFNHDTCHETIYCEIPEIDKNFVCKDLPKSFRQVGYNEGQSWSVPTKFISDSLILEEKMIKENTIHSDIYHFWYIGKSYADAYPSTAFPLGKTQQKEYARRCIYYFTEYLNLIHDFENTKKAKFIDETSYMSLILMAEAYIFLNKEDNAIECYILAESFAPKRNDHLFGLARIYKRLKQYEEMLQITSVMINPERKNPFPEYCNFIDSSLYINEENNVVEELHNFALSHNTKEQHIPLPFYINLNKDKNLFVVDNFYTNPDDVRDFALNFVEYKEDLNWYKGLRSTVTYRPDGIKEAFEEIIGKKIYNFEEHGFNGVFQITSAKDPQVYHYDAQKWAAMIYLTPNSPLESGTRTHRSKLNGTKHASEPNVDFAFNGNFYDSTKFEIIDNVGNIYNRLVIMDAQNIHSAGPYFGSAIHDSRLTHLFFFD